MKKLLHVFFLFLFIAHVSGQRFDINIMLEGRQRECIIVKPSHDPPAGGYPVVFMLHGSAQDGEQFYDISGWKELGEQENFITVFPTSLRWCYLDDGFEVFLTRWVNGNVIENPCSGPPQNYVDDVKFLKLLVKLIHDSLPVNLSKVYASGFSNGSAMIHKLAMDAGDVFAAVAGSSGPLSETDSVESPVNRIPIWFILGSHDEKYIHSPFTELPFGGDSILKYLEKSLGRALACQGLTSAFMKSETPITHTYLFNESQPLESSAPYLFTIVKDMVHVYPNGNNYPLSAARVFWEFFKQHTLVSSTKNNADEEELLTVYPNPSQASIHVIVNSMQPSHYRVLNPSGQILYQDDVKAGSILELCKAKTGAGLFILQVYFNDRVISKKIIFE